MRCGYTAGLIKVISELKPWAKGADCPFINVLHTHTGFLSVAGTVNQRLHHRQQLEAHSPISRISQLYLAAACYDDNCILQSIIKQLIYPAIVSGYA